MWIAGVVKLGSDVGVAKLGSGVGVAKLGSGSEVDGGSGKSHGLGTRPTGSSQVAARTTPWPRSCALICENSMSMYALRYRTKGRSSGAPPASSRVCVRELRVAHGDAR